MLFHVHSFSTNGAKLLYLISVFNYQVNTQKPTLHKNVFMVITTDRIIAMPRSPVGEIIQGQEPWSCSYVQIESVFQQKSPANMPGYFGIVLNFYNRDADAAKVERVTFDCKEQVDFDEEGEEVKGGEPAGMSRTLG